jgi:uncharacterized membrane protein YsdA (DUF1294 family)
MHNIVLWYAGLINVGTFLLYGWDKFCAQHQWRRISEMTLLFMAAIGGSLGALFGMKIFHHKTLHLKFRLGVPLLLILQVAALIYLTVLRK